MLNGRASISTRRELLRVEDYYDKGGVGVGGKFSTQHPPPGICIIISVHEEDKFIYGLSEGALGPKAV